jgi:hypothetical protein
MTDSKPKRAAPPPPAAKTEHRRAPPPPTAKADGTGTGTGTAKDRGGGGLVQQMNNFTAGISHACTKNAKDDKEGGAKLHLVKKQS